MSQKDYPHLQKQRAHKATWDGVSVGGRSKAEAAGECWEIQQDTVSPCSVGSKRPSGSRIRYSEDRVRGERGEGERLTSRDPAERLGVAVHRVGGPGEAPQNPMATAQGLQDPEYVHQRVEGQIRSTVAREVSLLWQRFARMWWTLPVWQREVCDGCPGLVCVAESWPLSSYKGRGRLVKPGSGHLISAT